MVAAFVTSPQGIAYGNVCERFGVDPAAGIPDDVMAYNVRAGLSMAMNEHASRERERQDVIDEHRRLLNS